jgi:hypothetical protein
MCLALGINTFLRPSHEYPRFGLPLELSASLQGRDNRHENDPKGTISPLIYLKGIRESTYGLALIVLQYQGYNEAVTSLLAVLSLAGLGDGFIVWKYGGDRLRMKALGHWVTFVGLAGWSWWRATSAY